MCVSPFSCTYCPYVSYTQCANSQLCLCPSHPTPHPPSVTLCDFVGLHLAHIHAPLCVCTVPGIWFPSLGLLGGSCVAVPLPKYHVPVSPTVSLALLLHSTTLRYPCQHSNFWGCAPARLPYSYIILHFITSVKYSFWDLCSRNAIVRSGLMGLCRRS